MKSIHEFQSLYVHRAPVDMRKNINGLAAIVATEMRLDLKSSSLFIFCNGRRTRMKILYFDRSGFALWFKRLEGDKFPWPKNVADETLTITARELALLLEGINIFSRFEEIHFDHLV